MTINDLKAQHPMPWTYSTLGSNVLVTDAQGQQVQLFTILDFTLSITHSIAAADAKAAQQPH